jgi:CheY-like chemotaxis protein
MPAAVLVVHDEQNTRELAVSALRAAFIEAVGFADPMAALDAIQASSHIRVLVTRVMFGPDKLNGIALARMVRVKRPDTRVVFVARNEYAPYAEGLGVFLPRPFNPDIFVATVSRLLVARDDDREVESPARSRRRAGRRCRAEGEGAGGAAQGGVAGREKVKCSLPPPTKYPRPSSAATLGRRRQRDTAALPPEPSLECAPCPTRRPRPSGI